MEIDDEFFIKEGEAFRNRYPLFDNGEFLKAISYLVLYVPVRIRIIKEHIILN